VLETTHVRNYPTNLVVLSDLTIKLHHNGALTIHYGAPL